MWHINPVRLTGATVAVVLGLGSCGDSGSEVTPETNLPAAVTPTVAQPEQFPNDCPLRLPRIDTIVRC